MPQFEALQPLFIVDRYIEPGERFESDLPPGRNWKPLDDAAKAAVEKLSPERKALNAAVDKLEQRRTAPGAVEIPANWAELSAAKRRGLATKLGAQNTIKADDADKVIQAELDRRAEKAAG
jgi:hypothetical protein